MNDTLSVFIVSQSGSKSVRRLFFPRFAIFSVFFLVLFSFCFTSIIAWNVAQYGANQILLIREEIKNAQMENELVFLRKIAEETGAEMAEIFQFDDNLRLVYGMQPVHKDIREVGVGGPERRSIPDLRRLEPHAAETMALRSVFDKMLRQAEFEIGSIAETQKEVVHVSKKLRRFPSVLPVFGQITSGYGYRFHPIERIYMNHDGIDIANVVWTPIYATADGVVSMAEYTSGYGNLIVLDHGYGTATYYGHLQEYAVKARQFVIRGDLLGYVGNSGRTTGPHLHYEIRKNNKPKDPLEFIYPVSSLIN